MAIFCPHCGGSMPLDRTKALLSRRRALALGGVAAAFASSRARAQSATSPVASFTASSGYNNLANWPSINSGNSAGLTANRPIVSGSVLNWIGPVGGGPSTTNDQAQSVTLSNSAPITISSNNQTVTGLAITSTNACITVGAGVTGTVIRNCYLQASTFSGVAVVVPPSAGTTIVEDCACNGTADGSGNYCFTANTSAGSGGTYNTVVYRCNQYGWIKGFGQFCVNSCLFDTYSHGFAGGDNDHVACWDGSSNLWVQHNAFDGSDTVGNKDDSCISITNYGVGSINNITFINNSCGLGSGASHQVVVSGTYGGSGPHGGPITGITFANNGFLQNNYGGQDTVTFTTSAPTCTCGTECSASALFGNSGNYNQATFAATSGTPINGTGAL